MRLTVYNWCVSIGEMTKIDNLVHIAHNVKMWQSVCLLTAAFAVAGVQKWRFLYLRVCVCGIAPHVCVGNKSTVAAKSGV